MSVKSEGWKSGRKARNTEWVRIGGRRSLGELKLGSRAKQPPTGTPAGTCNHPCQAYCQAYCQAIISDHITLNTCIPPRTPSILLHSPCFPSPSVFSHIHTFLPIQSIHVRCCIASQVTRSLLQLSSLFSHLHLQYPNNFNTFLHSPHTFPTVLLLRQPTQTI